MVGSMMTVDHGQSPRTMPLIECDVTLLSPEEGGRTTPFPAGAFSDNRYRPDIVVGDPGIRHAAVDNRGVGTEEYIGVAFSDGPHLPAFGKEMKVLRVDVFSKPDVRQAQAGRHVYFARRSEDRRLRPS
jgi:hypothetical protein